MYNCWVPGCLRPRAPLETDPLCAVDSLSFSLLLSFSSPSNRKQRILQCYFSNLNHVDSLLVTQCHENLVLWCTLTTGSSIKPPGLS
ncbi:hypothetical protein ACN38_g464 [Penicillium nordicum]|uniref:Uncharacterized protein n=1 Tax=Penicillium nordicum TaxID=229535 RepID=A0A0M9WKR3_9EURO|nr:hypothetical protein ACN38_g464 [Penicillium nordicum]